MKSTPSTTVQSLQASHAEPDRSDLRQHAPLAPDIHISPPRLAYSVKETAQILGVSEKTVRRLVARGFLRCSRALRHLLIPKKEIERFLDETSRQ